MGFILNFWPTKAKADPKRKLVHWFLKQASSLSGPNKQKNIQGPRATKLVIPGRIAVFHVTHCKCGLKAQINLYKSVLFNNLVRNHVEKVYFKCFHRTLLTIYKPEINIRSHQSHLSCNSRKISRKLKKANESLLWPWTAGKKGPLVYSRY
jgi:hypothetical protein